MATLDGKGDHVTTLQDLKDAVQAFVRERDWERFHSPKNLSMALAAEAAELMEHFLWDSLEDSHQSAKKEEVADELADILLYLLEFANMTGIDISEAVAAKAKKNAEKYPLEKSRGNSLKYTEL
ncbi:MAG: MazG-like family protein [Opitutales bacterium]|jgi:dCTP diphosphatase